ncbi:MAG: ABC transporter family substrate-binding protein [Pseudonocardia sp.]|nr:ABC transporter family substrate-binding protein [Pseudonocardia sp.]
MCVSRTRTVLLLLLAVLLAACSNSPTTPPPPPPIPTPQKEPTQLVVGVDAIPSGFNPHLIGNQSPLTTALATLVLPSVFRPDARGALQIDPTIATSATVSSTAPFTVTYELNLEASWSDNAPIAAEDFVYLWERMRGDVGTTDAAGYRLITDIKSRAGGKAVDVVFSHAYPGWQRLFSDLLPAHLLKDAPGSWTGALAGGLPTSGGPFKVIGVDRARGQVQLARNDAYWATPAVLDQLEFRRLDAAGMVAGLSSGDIAIALPEADQAVRTALGGLSPAPHVQIAPQPVVTQLGLRGDSGPMADPRVRQAMGAIIDRDAVRAAVAPEALPADAFGLAPSEPGYASTAPAGAPARPDPAYAARQLTAAGWARNAVTGRWDLPGGRPSQLVIGAAAERPEDQQVAQVVAKQLAAAGIAATVVAPTATDLFGLVTVPPTPPSPSPTPSVTPTPTPGPTRSAAPTTTSTSGGGVRVDMMVLPRNVGGDLGTELSSDYGCPQPTALVPAPPRSPTGFCSPALQPLFDELTSANPRPDLAGTVERLLWQQMPALPLFQPVTLVVSTAAADAATNVGPGPLESGPLTGAEDWRPSTG